VVSALGIAGFALAFAAGHATGAAHASPPTLRPLRAPVGGLVLPQLSQVPALPTLAAAAPKPKPVVVRPSPAPAAPVRQQRPKQAPPRQPKPKPKPKQPHVTRPAAAAKRVPRPASPKPVVIVGSG
jgi:outer membrane biosynthesis protein TonB